MEPAAVTTAAANWPVANASAEVVLTSAGLPPYFLVYSVTKNEFCGVLRDGSQGPGIKTPSVLAFPIALLNWSPASAPPAAIGPFGLKCCCLKVWINAIRSRNPVPATTRSGLAATIAEAIGVKSVLSAGYTL